MFQLLVDFVIVSVVLVIGGGGGGGIFAFPVWKAGGIRISESIASDSGCATRTFTELSSNSNSLRLNVFHLIQQLIF